MSVFNLTNGTTETKPHCGATASIVDCRPVSYASCDIHIIARALPIFRSFIAALKLAKAVALY
jgi:hypothetical protein